MEWCSSSSPLPKKVDWQNRILRRCLSPFSTAMARSFMNFYPRVKLFWNGCSEASGRTAPEWTVESPPRPTPHCDPDMPPARLKFKRKSSIRRITLFLFHRCLNDFFWSTNTAYCCFFWFLSFVCEPLLPTCLR